MPKHFLSTPLVIATMAFALVAFLFLIDTSINEGVSSAIPRFFNFKKIPAVACTLEAKQCPDGSYVGRTGPKCEFTACPATNTNTSANSNQNLNTSDELIPGRDLYINKELGFSFQYPTTFGEFKSTNRDTGYQGQEIASAGNNDGTISIAIKDERYDASNISGFYGPVEKQYIKSVQFGARAGSMFKEGDAGCGAQVALTALATTKTLFVNFSDCVDDSLENANTSTVSFYDDIELIESILGTFVFAE